MTDISADGPLSIPHFFQLQKVYNNAITKHSFEAFFRVNLNIHLIIILYHATFLLPMSAPYEIDLKQALFIRFFYSIWIGQTQETLQQRTRELEFFLHFSKQYNN